MPIVERPAPKFKPGDQVIYTNEYGMCWGVQDIEGVEWDIRRQTYVYTYENMDTPWSPVDEERLQPADEEDVTHPKCVHPADAWYDETWPYFQAKYGFPTTDEQRAALLDTDPFEGEQ